MCKFFTIKTNEQVLFAEGGTFAGAYVEAVKAANGEAFQMFCETDGCCYVSSMGENALKAMQAEYPAGTVFCAGCQVSPVCYDGGTYCRKCQRDVYYFEQQAEIDSYEAEMTAIFADAPQPPTPFELHLDWCERVEDLAARRVRYVPV